MKNKEILVFDDVERWLEMIARILTSRNYLPVLCQTLEDAFLEVNKRI